MSQEPSTPITKMNVLQRREKVKILVSRGANLNAIAKEFGVNRQTITRDIKALKNELLQELNSKPMQDIFAEFLMRYDLRYNRLWNNYTKAEASGDVDAVTRCLREIRKCEEQRLKIFQIFNIIPRPETILNQNNNVASSVQFNMVALVDAIEAKLAREKEKKDVT